MVVCAIGLGRAAPPTGLPGPVKYVNPGSVGIEK